MALTTEHELRWGRLPVGFLARHVAEVLEPGPLPDDLVAAIGVPEASIRDLTMTGLEGLPQDEGVLERVGDEVVAYVQERVFELLDVPLVRGPLPARPELAVRRWPARPRNVLLRTGLAVRRDRLRSRDGGRPFRGTHGRS